MVTDVITHPSYRDRTADLFNDIAMIKHEPISLNQYARVSGLDYVTMIGQEVTLFGYGKTTKLVNLNNKTSTYVVNDATTLGKPLQFLDGVVAKCNILNIVLKPCMCIARRCGKVSGICPGDSGGPVLHDSGVVAVNSIIQGSNEEFCLLKPVAPFYDAVGVTPTSPYIDWISSLIGNEVPKQHLTTETREHW
ncbi:hypothetical protein PYW07_006030 [Mythimna separata]|uniref:Peptidase S1 domain-containing protein n=1 Tax=Mythimna separata TaxID=271217 RepID=A0AAD7YKP7_MYTSE|nr:hypothetical protein PYW07_006030 [Mythimna separata]